jgi:hypothetical protein
VGVHTFLTDSALWLICSSLANDFPIAGLTTEFVPSSVYILIIKRLQEHGNYSVSLYFSLRMHLSHNLYYDKNEEKLG